jgi:hypothetical protein
MVALDTSDEKYASWQPMCELCFVLLSGERYGNICQTMELISNNNIPAP